VTPVTGSLGPGKEIRSGESNAWQRGATTMIHRARYRRIVFFFGRIITSLFFWDILLPRLGLKRWSGRTRSHRLENIAIRFRGLAIQMGGVMIKVGQFLSSRVDVLPEEITEQLSGLQDEVPAEKFEDIRNVAQEEIGPLETHFQFFEEIPLAAASLGQVHRAQLHEQDAEKAGFRDIVVKIQRPDIERLIATDLAALRRVAGWIQKYPPIAKRADIPALLNEFGRITFEEIDYLAEGRNAETFAANFRNRPGVRVPRVVWSHTTKRVLVLEDVLGIKITDYEAINKAGIERAQVAQRLFETYLQQIFEDDFFHADPHPGNLFVSPIPNIDSNNEDGKAWNLTFVDFGMVGRVPPNLKAGLRELAIGVGTQDASRVIRSYQLMGVLLPHADLELLEKAEAQAFERFWGKSMTELQHIDLDEMHEFAKEYRELIYTMPFQVPNDIIFLVRCVAILSGMCTGLDPDFNVWTGITPFAQKLITDEISHGWQDWFEGISSYGRLLFNLPRRLDSALTRLNQGDLVVKTPDLTRQISRLERANRRLVSAVIFTGLLISGVQLYLADEFVFTGILLGGSLLALGRSLFSRRN
jgi:predicted unusual protein kinase regulating ubiquinone biosynthesis (AarF/ABC1/UbiB family)